MTSVSMQMWLLLFPNASQVRITFHIARLPVVQTIEKIHSNRDTLIEIEAPEVTRNAHELAQQLEKCNLHRLAADVYHQVRLRA